MNKPQEIYVTKMSGEKVLFDEKRLKNSLKRSNADPDTIEEVVEKIKTELYDLIPTREIYRIAFSMLRKKSGSSASRYKLKRAILELGPSGFPFEKYISELLKFRNYETRVGEIVKGHCVSHEIDIIANKEDRHLIIECKFHSDQRRFCDVKVPLYIHSRFKDVESELKKKKEFGHKTILGGLVTNTRFSADALQYGQCMGMFMLSWDYPGEKSLKSVIDRSGLHPVTSLLTITMDEKTQLLTQGIVLCKSLAENPDILKNMRISPNRIQKILQEVRDICECKPQ
jgi:Holliday junction resolvase